MTTVEDSLDQLCISATDDRDKGDRSPGHRHRSCRKGRLTGETVAIRCKFYDPPHYLAMEDIDSFPAAAGKQPFGQRLIVSTTDNLVLKSTPGSVRRRIW